MKFINKSLPCKEISHISFLKKLHLEVDLLDDADQQTVHVVVQGRAHLQETVVQSLMTDVPDNRTSQMAEFKQIEKVYKIIVFF